MAKEEEGTITQTPKSPWKVLLLITFAWLFLLVLSSFLFLKAYLKPMSGRTNVLLLGITGKDYIGGDLSDTIIFASVENQTGKVVLISLPRDLWIPSMQAKLNSAYHYGGINLAKSTVSEVVGQPVDYGVIVDADLFVKLIDSVGGVDIQIENSFEDDKYPVPGREKDLCGGDPLFLCRYEKLVFNAGLEHMDGERALKYVRSRQAMGDEGTDFARSQRQQQLLLAIKNKVLTPKYLLNFGKVNQIIRVLNENIETDFPGSKYMDLVKTGLRFRSEKLKMTAVNDNLLVTPPLSAKYDNQWVLVPRGGDFKEIQSYIEEFLSHPK